MTKRAGVLLAAILSIVFASSLVHAAFRERPMSYERFLKGDFQIQLEPSVKPDARAEASLLGYARWVQLAAKAKEAEKILLGEAFQRSDLPDEYYRMLEYESYYYIHAVITNVLGTDSQLTAVLLLGVAAEGWSPPSIKPAVSALHDMRTTFPKAWQSAVAPLLEAMLLTKAGQSLSEERASTVEAVKLLWANLAGVKDDIDPEVPQVKAFFSVASVRKPLRATYYLAISQLEYRLATMGDRVEESHLISAEAACGKILEEFPRSEQAGMAKALCGVQIPQTRRKGQ